MNSTSALKTGVLVSLLLSLGLTTAYATPKQRTIWIDRDDYLADPSQTAACEDQANTGDDSNPLAGGDALSIIKNVATKALVPPNQIDGCMQSKGYLKKMVTGSTHKTDRLSTTTTKLPATTELPTTTLLITARKLSKFMYVGVRICPDVA